MEQGSATAGRPAVFLDRDGVINENRADYVKSWDEFVFLPSSLDALRSLAAACDTIVVVSNQAAIGRGLVARETVEDIHRRMGEAIRGRGGAIDAIYYCPHHPDEGCACRKPRPGMLRQAAAEHGIDLARSYFIGDTVGDVEAAIAAGCAPILVLTGLGGEQGAAMRQRGYEHVPVVRDLAEAVALVSAALPRAGRSGERGRPTQGQP